MGNLEISSKLYGGIHYEGEAKKEYHFVVERLLNSTLYRYRDKL